MIILYKVYVQDITTIYPSSTITAMLLAVECTCVLAYTTTVFAHWQQSSPIESGQSLIITVD